MDTTAMRILQLPGEQIGNEKERTMNYYCSECKHAAESIDKEPCVSCDAVHNVAAKGHWEPIEPAPPPIDFRAVDDLLVDSIVRIDVILDFGELGEENHKIAVGLSVNLEQIQAVLNPKPVEPGLTGTNEPPEETIWQLGDRIADMVRELQGRLRKMLGENDGSA